METNTQKEMFLTANLPSGNRLPSQIMKAFCAQEGIPEEHISNVSKNLPKVSRLQGSGGKNFETIYYQLNEEYLTTEVKEPSGVEVRFKDQ